MFKELQLEYKTLALKTFSDHGKLVAENAHQPRQNN